MLPSVFRNRLENRQQDFLANNPPNMTGYLVDTQSIISRELKENPYFASISGLSFLETSLVEQGGEAVNDYPYLKALADGIKQGYSVMNKPPGSVREVKTYLNPKMSGHVGNDGGTKLMGLQAGKDYVVDMSLSGKLTTPIVMSLTLSPDSKLPQTAATGENYPVVATEQQPPPMQGSINGEGTVKPANPSNYKVVPAQKTYTPSYQGSSITGIDFSGRFNNPDAENGTDYLGNPIRTGVVYKPTNSIMGSLRFHP